MCWQKRSLVFFFHLKMYVLLSFLQDTFARYRTLSWQVFKKHFKHIVLSSVAIISDENSALIWMIVHMYAMYHFYLTLLKIFLHSFYFKQCDCILPRCDFLCIFLLVVWWACWISQFICHWVLEIFSHYILKCFFCFILFHLFFFLLGFQFPVC